MVKYLKQNRVGLAILLIWAIVYFTNILAFPVFFSLILYDYPGIGPLLSEIVFYLPIVIAALLLTVLSARIIEDRKFFLSLFPIQLAIAVLISLIDFRPWWAKDFFWFAGLVLVQGTGMLLGWLYGKWQKSPEPSENSENPANAARKKAQTTRILWILLAVDLVGWIAVSLIGIFATGHSF